VRQFTALSSSNCYRSHSLTKIQIKGVSLARSNFSFDKRKKELDKKKKKEEKQQRKLEKNKNRPEENTDLIQEEITPDVD
jgi:hypothetical protein